jgi:3-hydroxybutyryl-CoA dehydrogenase
MTDMSQPVVAVVGAGLMGHAIGFLFAQAGCEVRIQDPDAKAIEALPRRLAETAAALGEGAEALARITGATDLSVAADGADFVFEAAPERLPLKQAIFAELDRLTPETTILASNTSAIPIAALSAPVRDKRRVIGTHFWNPPHLIKLVEVVLMGPENRPAAERAMALLKRAGRHPVLVHRDIPGFIGNRLQHALKREAIALVAAGVCDAETVDDVVKLGFGARMAVLGPLEQSDLVGLDLTKAIHDVLMPDLDVTARAHPYLEALVAKGDLGMKTGKGFRTWTKEQADAVRARLQRFLAAASKPSPQADAED